MVATTVTTTTTATTATTATAVTPEVMAAVGVVAVILLIVLLISKELAGASEHAVAQRFSKVINISVVPLLLTFVAITVSKVLGVIG